MTEDPPSHTSQAEEIRLSLDRIQIYADGLPEVEQFQTIINGINRHLPSRDIDQLANDLDRVR